MGNEQLNKILQKQLRIIGGLCRCYCCCFCCCLIFNVSYRCETVELLQYRLTVLCVVFQSAKSRSRPDFTGDHTSNKDRQQIHLLRLRLAQDDPAAADDRLNLQVTICFTIYLLVALALAPFLSVPALFFLETEAVVGRCSRQ